MISCQKTFNKIYYIFVRLFTSALCFIYLCIMFCVIVYLRILSFPFDVTFYRDGRKIFVNSAWYIQLRWVQYSWNYFRNIKLERKCFKRLCWGILKTILESAPTNKTFKISDSEVILCDDIIKLFYIRSSILWKFKENT